MSLAPPPAESVGNTHRCPITGCMVRLPHHILLCGPHWARVPKELQIRVNATWRSGPTGDYLAARQAAIDAVTRQILPLHPPMGGEAAPERRKPSC